MPYFDIAIYLFAGTIAGLLSGLLGVGGGIVVVPCLAFIFDYHDFPNQSIMHMAVATSLFVMIATTSRAAHAHLQKCSLPKTIAYPFVPGVAVGALVGSIIAHHLNNQFLQHFFIVFLLMSALNVAFDKTPQSNNQHHPLRKLSLSLVGGLIGVIASLLGIGGSVLSVPFFLYLGLSMREAVALASFTTVPVAIVGSLTYMLLGSAVINKPSYTIGYVFWPGALMMAIGGFIFAPIGANLAHYFTNRTLKIFFILFLLITGILMNYA